MRVGYFQFDPVFGETEENLERLCEAVAGTDADILVLPELATSGYLFASAEEVTALSDTIPGAATERLQAACRASGCRVVAGLAERAGGPGTTGLAAAGLDAAGPDARRFYNSAALIGPAGVEGVYRKAHLFNTEKLYFAPGDALPIFEVDGVKVGMLVCFDHMFPEAARTLALQGAQLICHPSNLVLPEYAQLTTRVRAIENRVFWVMCNRYGTESRAGTTLRYTGASQITAADGTVLSRAEAEGDALSVVEIDPARASSKKITEHNDLFADRRVELYRSR
jgi:predicted amidohydrolase